MASRVRELLKEHATWAVIAVLTVGMLAVRSPKHSVFAQLAPNAIRRAQYHARLGYIDFGRFRRAPQLDLNRCLNCVLHPQEDIPTLP